MHLIYKPGAAGAVTEMAKPCNEQRMNRKWFVVYTRPRWEKKVDQLLAAKGIERYCPLHKVKRRWSDRVKLVELPLLTSYVFVCVEQGEMAKVRNTPGVLNFIYWNGLPAVVRESEIAAIRRFLEVYEEVEAIRLDVKPGDEVKVASGLLMDRKAKVLEVKRKKVKIRIESLGCELVAYVDKSRLQ